MIDFPKNVSIEACEKFLEKLASTKRIDSLQLPVETASYAFGGLASAIQAVNTWARVSENRLLVLRASSVRDEQGEIDELIKRPHRFVAAMSAKSIVTASEPEQELRHKVNAEARLAIERQSNQQTGQQRGPLCWFTFVDHSTKGFDRNFYIENEGERSEPRQLEQFKAVIRTMVNKSMTVAGGAKALEQKKLDYVGRIFYELFLNTHEHGTRGDFRHEWLIPGVRLIYVNGINLDEPAVISATRKQLSLAAYLAAVNSGRSGETQRRFVEIGIVDSGLGYCGRWLSDRLSADSEAKLAIAEEYEIFKRCFKFRQTSTGIDGKGFGLPAVMDRLTKLSGFMRVRSGRLALYRDFLQSPHTSDDACHFSDWQSGQSAEQALTPMAQAKGVAISLLIPLEAK